MEALKARLGVKEGSLESTLIGIDYMLDAGRVTTAFLERGLRDRTGEDRSADCIRKRFLVQGTKGGETWAILSSLLTRPG